MPFTKEELNELNRLALDNETQMTVHILRNWDKDKIDRFAKHLLGDKCQSCIES